MPAADLNVEAVSQSTLEVLQVAGGEGHQTRKIDGGWLPCWLQSAGLGR
jgi:hypothetical protein